eukprot:81113-Lingulodinium_polyedra.AAC.1
MPQWRQERWQVLWGARAAGRPGPLRARAAWVCAARAAAGTCRRSRGPVFRPGLHGSGLGGRQ